MSFELFIDQVLENKGAGEAQPQSELERLIMPWSIRGKQELWDFCPEAFRQVYVEKHPRETTPEILLGRAVDKAQELFFRSKFNRCELDFSEVQDAYRAAFDRGRKDVEDWRDVHPDSVLAYGFMILEVFYQHYAKMPEPLGVQLEVGAPVGGTVVRGYIDLVDAQETIIDLKCLSPRADVEHLAQYGLQLTAYSLGYRSTTGRREKACRLDVVRKARPAPVFDSYLAERSESDYAVLEHAVSETIKCIRAGLFPPNTTGPNCRPDRCFFWKTCRARSPKIISIGG